MIKNSDKNKLLQLYLEQNKIKGNISFVGDINNKKQKDVNAVNNISDVFSKVGNLNQDWKECIVVSDLTDSEDSWTGEQFANWDIYLGILDYRFLPYFKYDIVYSLISDDSVMAEVVGLKNFYYSYEDIIGEEFKKNITFHASIHFKPNAILNKINPLSVKLFFMWDNIPLIKKQLDNNEETSFDSSIMYSIGWSDGVPSNIIWGDGGGMAG